MVTTYPVQFLFCTLKARTVKVTTEHQVRWLLPPDGNSSSGNHSQPGNESHGKAHGCCAEGPTDLSEGQKRCTVGVFPGDMRLNLPSSKQQGAATKSLCQLWEPAFTWFWDGTTLVRKQSNELTDTWEILITKFLWTITTKNRKKGEKVNDLSVNIFSVTVFETRYFKKPSL